MSTALTDTPPPDEPRLPALTRRTLLLRAVAGGALVAVPGLACGHDDASVFADGETVRIATDTGSTSDVGSATTAAIDAADPTSTAPVSTDVAPATDAASSATTTTEAAIATEDVVPASAEVIVSFTYQPTQAGGENPYLAVWVEDPAGELVDTIAVWFDQGPRGQRWLDDLVQWYAATGGGAASTVSGATRVAGSYAVAWDVTDLAGDPIEPGDYVVFVEAAREDGPYSVTSTGITIGSTPSTVTFPDATELVATTAVLEI